VISGLAAERTKQATTAAVAELRAKAEIEVLDPTLGWAP
jgi:hypothetical protein